MVNVPWCHDCDKPEGLCICVSPPVRYPQADPKIQAKPSRVFVPHRPMRFHIGKGIWIPSFDLSAASVFGTVTVILPGRPSVSDPTILVTLKAALADFTEYDFIMPVGSPIIIAWTAMEAAAVCKRVTMLEWSHEDATYTPITREDNHVTA